MKHLKTALILVLIMSLTGCQNSGKKSDEKDSATGEKKEMKAPAEKKPEKLTMDMQARNIFKNSMTIFSGTMALAFDATFQQMAEGLSKTFSSGSVKEMDAGVSKLDAELLKKLDDIKAEMDKTFEKMKNTDEKAYNKLLMHNVMKEGIDIANKYKLPKGFPPLTQDLTNADLKRYIVKISTSANNADDEVIKMYTELMQWFQRVDKELSNDPEIKQMMENTKK